MEFRTYLGYLLHVCDHFIISLGLLAEPRKEGLAVGILESIGFPHGDRQGTRVLELSYLSRCKVVPGSVHDTRREYDDMNSTETRSIRGVGTWNGGEGVARQAVTSTGWVGTYFSCHFED